MSRIHEENLLRSGQKCFSRWLTVEDSVISQHLCRCYCTQTDQSTCWLVCWLTRSLTKPTVWTGHTDTAITSMLTTLVTSHQLSGQWSITTADQTHWVTIHHPSRSTVNTSICLSLPQKINRDCHLEHTCLTDITNLTGVPYHSIHLPH